DAVDRRLELLLRHKVRGDPNDRTVHCHEKRHPERRDQIAPALDGREELERGNRPDLVPVIHRLASVTTLRKMSSMGASSGSKLWTSAPAPTSARSSAEGSVPGGVVIRHSPSLPCTAPAVSVMVG